MKPTIRIIRAFNNVKSGSPTWSHGVRITLMNTKVEESLVQNYKLIGSKNKTVSKVSGFSTQLFDQNV